MRSILAGGPAVGGFSFSNVYLNNAFLSSELRTIRGAEMRKSVLLGVCFSACVSLSSSPSAGEMGAIILTIDGRIASDSDITFTRSQLEALETTIVVTTTPWHEGRITFEGVSMQRLMEEVGATGSTAFVMALNNYSTEIPLSDFSQHKPILALKRDGKYMEIADKGPLFVIYPYDSAPALKSELYYSRSAWQVRSITIE